MIPRLKKLLEILREFEGLRLEAYQDGGGVWTIGYGHTGPDVYEGLVITPEQAEALLLEDALLAARAVQSFITQPVTQNQLCAMTSLTYNIGMTAFIKSTLRRKFNAKAPLEDVASEFSRWNKDNGHVVMGLTYRRAKEAALFLTPDEENT